MFGKNCPNRVQFFLLEGPVELHVAKIFAGAVVIIELLLILVVRFVNVVVKQVLLAIDIASGIDDDLALRVPHRFNFALVGA